MLQGGVPESRSPYLSSLLIWSRVAMRAHVVQILLLLDRDVFAFRLQLCRSLLAGEETARSQEHHQHQRQTEDQIAIFTDVVIGQKIIANLVAKGIQRASESAQPGCGQMNR